MESDERGKRALLIGINQYPKLSSRSQLNGCVNDVELMANVLQQNFAFPESNIRILRNEEATRAAILQAFDTFITEVQRDDIVVIHYSGHGSQMTDREGDEPDGLDETIVPYDSGRAPEPNLDITDDEIYLKLLQLNVKTPYVTLIFDCCNSGTISRDTFGAAERWIPPDERPVDQLPDTPLDQEEIARVKALADAIGPSGWLPLGQRYVLIAGCRDEESSYEYSASELPHGTLTYFLCQELVKATSGSTYRDVFDRANLQIVAASPRQHPQMEGARDRQLFDIHSIEPMSYVKVLDREGDRVTLAAGAAHGMTVGSRWAIYADGVNQVSEETPKLGEVEITAVRAVNTDALIQSESASGAIGALARAVEEAHDYGEMRLVVQLQADAGYVANVDRFTTLVGRSQLLRLAQAGEEAQVRVYLLAPRGAIDPNAATVPPVPQLGALAEASWAVVGVDGRLVMPVHKVSSATALSDLRDNLEKYVRYRQMLVLRNASEQSALKGKLEMALHCPQADGTWVEVQPQDDSGEIVFPEGQQIAIRITNHHSAPLFFSIFDMGISGAISQFHPPTGASEQLAPGGVLDIGIRTGEELELYMPENFPYVTDPGDSRSARGTETFKLFATSVAADFSSLMQQGFRGVDRALTSPLNALLTIALTGEGTREVRRTNVPANDEWTTVERTFTLRR